VIVRLLELTSQRQIADLRSRLQRTDPAESPDDYRRLFEELAGLEQRRRALRNRLAG
jgi:DNA primase